jgi:hypothetical protein
MSVSQNVLTSEKHLQRGIRHCLFELSESF